MQQAAADRWELYQIPLPGRRCPKCSASPRLAAEQPHLRPLTRQNLDVRNSQAARWSNPLQAQELLGDEGTALLDKAARKLGMHTGP
jgi:hypothetical protein